MIKSDDSSFLEKKFLRKRSILQNSTFHFFSLESTNSWILQNEKNLPQGCIVSADFQTKGKGRWGRVWQAKKNESTMFSVLYRMPKKFSSQLASLACGVAMAEALKELKIKDIFLKWPNDILFKRKKLGGILCELYPDFLVLGIGINRLQTSFPLDIKNKATSLKMISKKNFDNFLLLELCTWHLDRVLFLLQEGKSKKILKKWESYASSYKNVSCDFGNKKIFGKIQGLDYESGALLVKTKENKIIDIIAGEVSLNNFY